MKCIACFIDNKYQNKLKEKCFGIRRFEDKLLKYKQLFLYEVNNLQSVSKCNCDYKNTNAEYVKWTDCFLNETKNSIDIIEDTFDELINIYKSYISENIKVATNKIWDFLVKNDLLKDTEGGFSYSTLFYRARIDDGSFDKNDINNFFHVPFDKRELIGNQRFSISGQPMLYLAKSMIGIEKELCNPTNKLAISAFLPLYKDFYSKNYYTIKNTLFNTIVKSLPSIAEVGSKLDYYNSDLTPNRKSLKNDLQKSILSQVLTFPVESKHPFMSEYVLPQMLTTALLENKYGGIAFPSTKDYSELEAYHKFSDYESNFAVFINYSSIDLYDNQLLNSFLYFTFNGQEKLDYTTKQILEKFKFVIELNKQSETDNFILPLINLKLHIEYLENATLDGISYFKTLNGKIELEFCSKLADFFINKIQ
ncbi:hypothetical protein GGR22_002912 [Flavobacterium gossypii]|uniref:RES domain-containing protein n=1 Tax=Flavobacterium gossypii TaxID=1646119 RepID=A0ABR6DSR1_9FLAO|nr:hypothetical protein [Flavobacterium gossypii]MBA9074739.1 hypothetical protein [Flavobacterium gossypii]